MLAEIEKKQRELHELARDYRRVRGVIDELQRASKRKPYLPRNDIAHDAIVCMHQMLIIDLAAWARSIQGKWLRRNIQGQTLAKF